MRTYTKSFLLTSKQVFFPLPAVTICVTATNGTPIPDASVFTVGIDGRLLGNTDANGKLTAFVAPKEIVQVGKEGLVQVEEKKRDCKTIEIVMDEFPLGN